GGDDLPPRIWIALDELDQVRDLVDVAAVCRLPVAPLLAVDRTEIAALVGPLIPDSNVALFQPLDVGVAPQKPQQFDDDRAQVELLGREQRETVRKVEAHLRS